jgi:hypothetical protein
MGWREDDELDEERYDRARDEAYIEPEDACGPDCVATICCKTASQAAASFCGCGGGYDHGDCPPVEDDEDDDDDEELRRYADAAYRMAVDAFGEVEVLDRDDLDLDSRVELGKTGAWVTLAVWVADADLDHGV